MTASLHEYYLARSTAVDLTCKRDSRDDQQQGRGREDDTRSAPG